MYQAHLKISGRVQGVFYRASCQDVAIKYSLKGYAKNLLGGDVEVVAQGEKDKIERLIEWCKKGPPGARVTNVKVDWEEPLEMFYSFDVR